MSLLILSCSCTRDTYILNAPNPTLFEKKGETQLQLNANLKSIQPQWGMSVSDKFAYQINGNLGFKGQSYIEGMGGLYLHNEQMGMEIYTGVGYGYLNYHNEQSTSFSNLEWIDIHTQYLKVPSQINLWHKFDKDAKVFLINRFSFLNYQRFYYNYTTYTDYREYDKEDKATETKAAVPSASGIVWDFGLGITVHRWIFQMGGSLNGLLIPHLVTETSGPKHTIISQKIKRQGPYYLPFYLTVGYSIDFGTGPSSTRTRKGRKGKASGEDIL